MPFLLDLSIFAIIAFCTWRGYKAGLVRGAFGIVGVIVAVIIANIAAAAYAEEFSGILQPFIGGIVETTITEVVQENVNLGEIDLDELGLGNLGIDTDDIDLENLDLGNMRDEVRGMALPAVDPEVAYAALRQIGLSESGALHISELVTAYDNHTIGSFAESIASNLANILSYIILFGLGFALISIIFAVIGNLVGVTFFLPGLEIVDIIGGALFGLIKGLLIVFAITTVVRYVGLLIGYTIERTSLLTFFINNNPIANMLGI